MRTSGTTPAVALVPGLRPDRLDATDLVCGVCDVRAALHPREPVAAQLELFLEQHEHATVPSPPGRRA